MSDSHAQASFAPRRRRHVRVELQCRARICIGARHYAGYLHNISRGGAKLRTITPIRKIGAVILRLPDLPPLRCRLRWMDSYNAGVAFELPMGAQELSRWAQTRTGMRVLSHALEVEIGEAETVAA